VVSAALCGAALLAMRRLASELAMRSSASVLVFQAWCFATLGIAGRLWYDVAREVLS